MQEIKLYLYYWIIAVVILLLLNWLFFLDLYKNQVEEVDYGTFMKMTEDKNIGYVEIGSDTITFTDKDKDKVYETGMIEDPGLVDRLYNSNAEFKTNISSDVSPFVYILVSYILPVVIFVAIWRVISKKMTEKINNGFGLLRTTINTPPEK